MTASKCSDIVRNVTLYVTCLRDVSTISALKIEGTVTMHALPIRSLQLKVNNITYLLQLSVIGMVLWSFAPSLFRLLPKQSTDQSSIKIGFIFVRLRTVTCTLLLRMDGVLLLLPFAMLGEFK